MEENKETEIKETEKKEVPKKDNNKIIIITLAALLLIAIVVIVIIAIKPKGKDNGGNTTTTTTTEVVETVTITFDVNGGEPVEPMVVKKGEEVTLPSTTREGYIFNGWLDDNDDMPNTVTSFDTDKFYTANWTPIDSQIKTMNVSFDSNGGSKVNPILLQCTNDTATVNALPKNPTKSGYKFRAWEDKNGKVILPGAKLTCANIKLYAAWDKEDEQNKAKCPEGYNQNGSKCTQTKDATKYCPDGTREDGDKCVTLTDYNKGTRTCPNMYIEGHDYQGTKVDAGTTFCLYAVYTSITNQTTCENTPNGLSRTSEKERYYGWYGGKCYKAVLQNYETTCSSGYTYYTSADILNKFGGHNNAGCYKTSSKSLKCDTGYDVSGDKCVKTVDAE